MKHDFKWRLFLVHAYAMDLIFKTCLKQKVYNTNIKLNIITINLFKSIGYILQINMYIGYGDCFIKENFKKIVNKNLKLTVQMLLKKL